METMYYTHPSKACAQDALLGMEHNLAHSGCSLSGDVVMKVFMTRIMGEGRGFMQERSGR